LTHNLFCYLERLTTEEKDEISGLLCDRCEHFREALGVKKGSLKQVNEHTSWRERILQIFAKWEQENREVDIRNFLDCINKMHPLPHDVIKICLNTSGCCSDDL